MIVFNTKGGIVGIIAVAIVIGVAILLTSVLDIHEQERDEVRYDYITDTTSLFDYDRTPQYMDYDLAKSYVGYYTDSSYPYFSGVGEKGEIVNGKIVKEGGYYTTGVNRYIITYPPVVSETQTITLTDLIPASDEYYKTYEDHPYYWGVSWTSQAITLTRHVITEGTLVTVTVNYPDGSTRIPHTVTLQTLMDKLKIQNVTTFNLNIPDGNNDLYVSYDGAGGMKVSYSAMEYVAGIGKEHTAYTYWGYVNRVVSVTCDYITNSCTLTYKDGTTTTAVSADKVILFYGGDGRALGDTVSYYTTTIQPSDYLDISMGVRVTPEESVYHDFVLRYVTNDGTFIPSETARANTSTYTFTVSYTTPVRDGYVFRGWAVTQSGNPTIQPGDQYTVTEGTSYLYAVWQRAEMTYNMSQGIAVSNETIMGYLNTYEALSVYRVISGNVPGITLTTSYLGDFGSESIYALIANGTPTTAGTYGVIVDTGLYGETPVRYEAAIVFVVSSAGTYTVSFVAEPVEGGTFLKSGQPITQITVPDGTTFERVELSPYSVLIFSYAGEKLYSVQAWPNTNYNFDSWSSISGTITGDMTLTAYFTTS